MSLFTELKRRNVIRMAGLYLVGAWLIVQVAETVLPTFDVPSWVLRTIIILVAVGFFPALTFAWIFELTPDGLKRDSEVSPAQSIASRTGRRMDILLAVGLVAVVAIVVADRIWPNKPQAPEIATVSTQKPSPTPAPAAAEPDNTIAVLPFVDMSQGKDQEYFSDGLSEELLNLLAQLPQLKVIARTSSFSFKGKNVDVATIARTLGVGHVLEGSVRKSGNTLRITAQLIRTSDSTHLWSETFDRELTDVFAVQDEIANAVVDALKLKLLPDQTMVNHARSVNTEAYNEFLLGRQLYNQQNPEGWKKAVAAYSRAIKLDPQYAAAYAGLSQAGNQLADNEGDNVGKQRSLENANRAIALAPDLADGYYTRAMVLLSFTQDWAGAQADLEKALALNDSDSSVLFGYARFLSSQSRLSEAVAAARQATERDPLQTLSWAIYGRLLAANGEYQESQKAMERAVELGPTSQFALFHLGNAHLLAAHPDEALPIYQRNISGYGLVGVAMAEYSLGHTKESQAALDAAIANAADSAAYQIAEAYAWRGESDKAFDWLDRAVAQKDGGISFLRADPLLANVINDPRFAALLKRIGLVD